MYPTVLCVKFYLTDGNVPACFVCFIHKLERTVATSGLVIRVSVKKVRYVVQSAVMMRKIKSFSPETM